MFRGDRIDVTTFSVQHRLSSKRVRLVADVNGVTCFVKTFGDPVVQCTADELKRLVGLTALGVSRSRVPEFGDVLICRYLPDHQRGHTLDQATMERLAAHVLSILWFDVWIRNNDRTGTNLMVVGKDVVPIDESAAFKRESTFRLTPKQGWYAALLDACAVMGVVPADWRPSQWPPAAKDVTETVKRCDPVRWASVSWTLAERIRQMPTYWAAFWKDAVARVA